MLGTSLFICGVGGYIYLVTNVASGATVISAGDATTNDLLRIHCDGNETIVAVGANSDVIRGGPGREGHHLLIQRVEWDASVLEVREEQVEGTGGRSGLRSQDWLAAHPRHGLFQEVIEGKRESLC